MDLSENCVLTFLKPHTCNWSGEDENMSTAPIDRDTQIELMTTHKERRIELFSSVSSDSKVKRVLKKNTVNEETRFTRQETKVACYG